MGGLMRTIGSLLAYFAVATLLSQTAMLGYFLATGRLSTERRQQIAAVLQGVDLVPASTVEQAVAAAVSQVPIQQVSLEDAAAERTGKLRDLELREEALRKGLEIVDAKRLALLQEKQDFDSARIDFEKTLSEMRTGATAAGEENVRSILSNARPKQAKEQLMQMIEKGEMANVVSLLATMPATKRTKIIAEFKTQDEAETLDQILRLMRQGEPDVSLIDQTSEKLDQQPNRNP